MAVPFLSALLRTKIYTSRIAEAVHREETNLLAEGTVLKKFNTAYHIPFPDVF